MKRKLRTIGYTGFSIDEFCQKLVDNGIECLVDVREIPISRKPGFSKTALRQHLEGTGIAYHHYRLLGSPRSLRHDLWETGDYKVFFTKVQKHIASAEAKSQLEDVILIARRASACLMCCCPEWDLCHRKCVVEAISKKTHFTFEHLHQGTLRSRHRAA